MRVTTREVGAAVIVSMVTLITTVSNASLIASGPLSSHLPMVLSSGLLAGAAGGFIVARFNSLPFAIYGPAANASGFLSATLLGVMLHERSGAVNVADVGATLILSAFFAGAAMMALGHFRLGRAIRYVPFPVIAGFMAGNGWLIVSGGVRIAKGGWPLLAAAVFAAILWFAHRRSTSPYVLPICVGAGIILTHLALSLTHESLGLARAGGWLYEALPASGPPSLSPAMLSGVHWATVATGAATFAAIIVVIALMSMFSGAALELESGLDANFDRDLTVAGAANIASGAIGGFCGNLILSSSSLNYRLGGVSRFSATVVSIVSLVAVIGNNTTVAFLPKPIFAGVVGFLGVRFLHQYLIVGTRTMSRADIAIVIVMLLATAFTNSGIALVCGLLISCGTFIATCSRYRVLRRESTARTLHSRVERTREERAILEEQGDLIRILRLQGHLFFGSANALYEAVHARIGACEALILDFTFVEGIDASAAFSFEKLSRDAKRSGTVLIFAAASPEFADELRRRGIVGTPADNVFNDVEHALESREEILLGRLTTLDQRARHERAWFFDALEGEASVDRLRRYLEVESIDDGTVLFERGDAPDGLYLLREGRLSVTLDGVHLRTLLPGTLVGEMGLYTGESRSATVAALGSAVVERLSSRSFEMMGDEDPELLAAFHRVIVQLQSDRLRAANAELAALHD